ncbi:MAG: type I 3-dehydroquinate dehydratase [Patescibacteria group bacterium]
MQLCIPIKKIKDFTAAQKLADLTEIWFDEISGLSVTQLLKLKLQKLKPILYKVTTSKNLELILKSKLIDFIDFDISTNDKVIRDFKLQHPGIKLIISSHNFKSTPELPILKKLAAKILQKKADIIKIATQSNSFKDSLKILKLLNDLTQDGHPAICLAMSKEGEFTRIAGQFLGNYLMYAPLNMADSTAPGQIPAKILKKLIFQNVT